MHGAPLTAHHVQQRLAHGRQRQAQLALRAARVHHRGRLGRLPRLELALWVALLRGGEGAGEKGGRGGGVRGEGGGEQERVPAMSGCPAQAWSLRWAGRALLLRRRTASPASPHAAHLQPGADVCGGRGAGGRHDVAPAGPRVLCRQHVRARHVADVGKHGRPRLRPALHPGLLT